MSPELPGAELEQLFQSASRLRGDERERFLAAQAGRGTELVERLRALLAADEQSPSEFLREPVAPLRTPPEQRVGRYRLLRVLGEGGMGTVHLAEQEEPVRRLVALKTIRAGRGGSDVIARFQAERQALALINHPGIAQLYDGGVTDSGLPYFVMEYVEGAPLDAYCDRHRLRLPERLRVFVEVCVAVQHAHQKGVIHRDLKFSNVLVTERDGRATPKIIDFGIARALGGSLVGEPLSVSTVRIAGTRFSMSPEQARGEDVDTRTDVHALGVMLYALACGAAPFDPGELATLDTSEQVRQWLEEPAQPLSQRFRRLGNDARAVAEARGTAPRALERALAGDLEWITACALQRDRALRYPTASELGADVARHLADEPVSAAPPNRIYRAHKFVRRHRLAVALGSALGVVATAALVATLRYSADAHEAAERASYQAQRARGIADVLELGLEDYSGEFTREPTLRELVDGPIIDLDFQFANRPAVEAGVLTSLGRLLLELGEHTRAHEFLLRAQSLQQHADEIGPYERFETLDALIQAERRVNGTRGAEPFVARALAAAREVFEELDEREARALEALLRFEFGASVPGRELVDGLGILLEGMTPQLRGRNPRSHALGRVVFEVGRQMIERDVPETEAYLAELDARARTLLGTASYARFLWAVARDLLLPGHEQRELAAAYLGRLDAALAGLPETHWLRRESRHLHRQLER